MFNRCGSLFLLFLVALNGHATAKTNHFDVLIFTQRWPQTVCFTWKEESESHTCSLPRDKHEWTIHGVWPSEYHKLGPQFCNRSMPFSRSALAPLASQLKEKWIDIEYGRESYSLWQHEWQKHGTCAAVLEKLNTEVKYFAEGLNLLAQYDMKNVLAKANIMPGRKYAVTDMLNAIEEVLGTRGLVMCRKHRETGESYVFEIRICLNKQLELVDCDGVYQFPTNCDRYGSVTYPNDVPQMYDVQQV